MFSSKELSRSEEIQSLLNCRRLPARLSTGETAAVLGFREHDMATLVGARLLRPLGDPAANSPKHFASVAIIAHSQDAAWLSRATRVISEQWRRRNMSKKGGVKS